MAKRANPEPPPKKNVLVKYVSNLLITFETPMAMCVCVKTDIDPEGVHIILRSSIISYCTDVRNIINTCQQHVNGYG